MFFVIFLVGLFETVKYVFVWFYLILAERARCNERRHNEGNNSKSQHRVSKRPAAV